MSEQNYETLSANAEKMRELKKLFTITFIISAISPFLYTFLGLLKLASFIMTAGKVVPSAGFVFTAVLSVVTLICCSFSFMMEKKATIVSIPLLLLLAIIYMSSDVPFFILSAAGSAAHIWCFKQYSQIDYLKSQEGYPDFNAIVSSKYVNRRFTDEELKNMAGGSEKNVGTDFTMEELKLPSENKEN
ncbi:MAG: hypothetical protein IJZ72_02720 [Oscillospiraceae bacterium]|nr:hypothetical protein [Oscillospiraceae bacterium]